MESMLAMSEELKSHFSGRMSREQFETQAPVSIALADCGTLIVPFGGALLARVEAHLRTFDTPFKSSLQEIRWLVRAHAMVKNQHSNQSNSGSVHAVVALGPQHAEEIRPFVKHESMVLRVLGTFSRQRAPLQPLVSSTSPLHHIVRGCEDYRMNLWSTWLRWILGELGRAPKVLAMWLSASSKGPATEFLMERCQRLDEALSAPPSPSAPAPTA